MKPFIEMCENFIQDVKLVYGCHLSWKDANPDFWRHLPPQISQHQHPQCQIIKSDAKRVLQCSKADNIVSIPTLKNIDSAESSKLNPERFQPHLRTCPFGFEEWRIPVHSKGRYLGFFYLGLWGKSTLDGTQLETPSSQRQHAMLRLIQPWILNFAHRRASLDSWTTETEDPLIEKAIAHIRDHLHPKLSLENVAKAVHLSPSRLRHRLVENHGMTFTQILQKHLMKEAALRLIHDLKRPLQDLALEMGWNDQRYFSTSFKRYYGCTPSQWRKQIVHSTP